MTAMTDYQIRPATPADAAALARLGHESYGHPADEPPHPDPNAGGRTTWVAEAGGAGVGSAARRHYESWWWGERLRTAGIADVQVASEHRGGGVMRRLLDALLGQARAEGAVVSTLFPTAPGIYRSLGYEVVASYDDETVCPTTAFAGITGGDCTLRRAGPDDVPAIRRVQDAWGAQHNGPLVRSGPSFRQGPDMLERSIVTLAERAGEVVGVLVWKRDRGYSAPESVIQVRDLTALDAGAARTLLASIGTHAAVAPVSAWSTSGIDLARLLTPAWSWSVRRSHPYMLTVLDVPAALTSRRYPRWADLGTTFAVDGRCWRLTLADGRARVEPYDGEPATAFDARGFAGLWSGALSVATLHAAGLARGEAEPWDQLWGGREVHVRDYF